MRRRGWWLGLVVMAGAMVASPLLLRAQTAGGTEPAGWHGVTVDGLASLSYNYNLEAPANRVNPLRVFDFNDEEPQLDVAQLVLQRAVSVPGQLGFRFDVMAGSGVPEVTAAYGLFRNMHSGIAHHVDIPEMFVSYIVPVGKGLRIDGGKFVTHMGYEVIGGYDGFNDEYSRSFLFGYGIPFTHTGVKASYAFNSKVLAMLAVTNGWDDVQSLNSAYTVGGQLTVSPTKSTSVAFNFITGPERPHDATDHRDVYEVVGTWAANSHLSVGD